MASFVSDKCNQQCYQSPCTCFKRSEDYRMRIYTSMCRDCFCPATRASIHPHAQEDKDREAREIQQRLARSETRTVRTGAAKGRVDDMLEYGMRLCAGVRCIMDEDAGIELFLKVAEGRYPTEKRAIAYSLASHGQKSKLANSFFATVNSQNLYGAFLYANKSCELGFFSITCFLLLRFFDNLKLDRETAAPYQRFEALSRAYYLFRVETGMQRPHARICAVCGRYPKTKSSLKRCGGGCPPEQQPMYCSRECQVNDWPSHKQWCTKSRVAAEHTPKIAEVSAPYEMTQMSSMPHSLGEHYSTPTLIRAS